jgi:hypothetical protein
MTAPLRTGTFDVSVAPFHVLIIGGGIGGLCLAQGLKKAGISAAVYERDGNINPAGSRALSACLPPHLFDLFDRTCGKPGRAVHFMTEDMKMLLAFEGKMMRQHDPVAKHRSVSRTRLRQVLLAELDGIVHLGAPSSATSSASTGASLPISRTVAVPKAMFWSPPTAAARACGANSCRRPSASTPVWSRLPARSFSTRGAEGASRRSCSTASPLSRPAAGSAFSPRCRSSASRKPALTASAWMPRSKRAPSSTIAAAT